MCLSKIQPSVHAKPFRTWAYIETMNADFLNCSESTMQSLPSWEAPWSFRTRLQAMNLIPVGVKLAVQVSNGFG